VIMHSSLTPEARFNSVPGTVRYDSTFHPFGVGKLSNSFNWGLKSPCSRRVMNRVMNNVQWVNLIQKLHTLFCSFVYQLQKTVSQIAL